MASRRAARGKRRRPDVEAWRLREESELLALREELLSGGYQPGPYRFFTILRAKLDGVSRCPRVMGLIEAIISSYQTGSNLSAQWFPGDRTTGRAFSEQRSEGSSGDGVGWQG